jgi:hypothetical protein
MTLKQWQGISHQIDDSLRNLANQSLERLKGGGGDADLEKRKMIEARIRAAEMVTPSADNCGGPRLVSLDSHARESPIWEAISAPPTGRVNFSCNWVGARVTVSPAVGLDEAKVLSPAAWAGAAEKAMAEATAMKRRGRRRMV